MSIFLAILFGVPVLDLLWWWVADRRLRPLPGAVWWRVAWAAFVLLQFGTYAYVIYARVNDLPGEVPTALLSLVFIWHLVVLPLSVGLFVVLSVLVGGTRVALWLARGASSKAGDNDATEVPERVPAMAGAGAAAEEEQGTPELVPPDAKVTEVWLKMRREGPGREIEPPPAPREPLTRRQFLGAVGVMVPPVVTGVATAYAMPRLEDFRIRRIDIVRPDLPAALDGLRISHVSDTHVGRFTEGAVLDRFVEAANAWDDGREPDLVLFTGDLINDDQDYLEPAIAMARRMRGRYGFVMCEGNHDLIEGRDNFERTVRRARVNLLINESTTARINGQRVQILGLRWGSPDPNATRGEHRGDAAIRASMEVVRPLLLPDAYPILLAHHPHAFDVAAEMKIPLTLSGHTHGGQMMLTRHVGAGNLIGFRYMSGMYTKGDSALIVSNGAGNWFPLRINAPADIVHVTLHRAPSA